MKFVRDGRLRLNFVGKGGTEHDLLVGDRRLASIVRRCQQLPGQTLFQYLDDSGERHRIDSAQVNAYLQDAMGAEFTAKDFRTWGATLRAAALLGGTPLPSHGGERAVKTRINEVIGAVAKDLCNTPAVCRKSYINLVVFELWRSGGLQRIPASGPARRTPRKVEQAVMRVLRRHARGR